MRQFLLAISILLSITVNSQVLALVKWITSVEKLSGTEYELIAKAFTYDDSEGDFKVIGNFHYRLHNDFRLS
ncbi:hypothetical protein [Confluentibacter sediminis]|uniref:hypothetical protein n=1 Tax=Confluentibacter sediminis TaxID=2219045 RepID=UPI0013A70833|nr:hypothetical protein [Confluentibacter sediminis]